MIPDVECNVPSRNCDPGGHTQRSCCNRGLPILVRTRRADETVQLRWRTLALGEDSVDRIFERPAASRLPALASGSRSHDCFGWGSAFEASFEVARRAVNCSLPADLRSQRGLDCPEQAIADLNSGFSA
ncbi:MAG: hypothetical protein R3C68_14280 [Myxococcota bacterium]